MPCHSTRAVTSERKPAHLSRELVLVGVIARFEYLPSVFEPEDVSSIAYMYIDNMKAKTQSSLHGPKANSSDGVAWTGTVGSAGGVRWSRRRLCVPYRSKLVAPRIPAHMQGHVPRGPACGSARGTPPHGRMRWTSSWIPAHSISLFTSAGESGGRGTDAKQGLVDWCEQMFTSLDASMLELQLAQRCGSTGTVVLVANDVVHVANVGDSSAVLCRGAEALELTTTHRPDLPDEAARVQAAGGVVHKVLRPPLARSFGSLPLGGTQPRTRRYTLTLSLSIVVCHRVRAGCCA